MNQFSFSAEANRRVQRASLLSEQGRPEQAIEELQQALVEDPNNGLVHALLAANLAELDRLKEATEQAQQAVHLAPELPLAHRVLGHIWLERRDHRAAEAAIRQAIELENTNAGNWALLARVYVFRRRWSEVLEAAELGLEQDPEHNGCINLRSMALVHLGRKEEAGQVLDAALARNPEDATSHANRGWSLLHAGQTREALGHFREALRLQPENAWAKSGIVEALKARNPIYRWMLAYFLWMTRLPPQARWGVVIGGYLLIRFANQAAAQNPDLDLWVFPLTILYMVFAIMTWLSAPLFNLLLRLDRFGRYALSPDQIWGANALGICLAAALLSLIAGFVGISGGWFWAAFVFGLLSILVSATFACSPGKPRLAMAGYTLIAALVGLAPAVAEISGVALLPEPTLLMLIGLFPFSILVGTFVANGLVGWTPKR